MSAPRVGEDVVRFTVSLPDADLLSVQLDADRAIPGERAFERLGHQWQLSVPWPPLQRFEYRFQLRGVEQDLLILDPANPLVVDTAFGQRSVVTRPEYRPPWWLEVDAPPGHVELMRLEGEIEGGVPVSVWSPEGLARHDPAPLLLVHDGPEYDQLSAVTRYSAAMIATGTLPPHRLVLAHPVLRDAWYSGSPRYLRTVSHHGLVHIASRYAVRAPVAVMGASLGGLTALLVGLAGDSAIGAVFAQSGSFFQERLDPMERGFRWFDRISRRVAEIIDTPHADHPLRIGMTCGALEENASNNRAMAAALRRTGHTVTYSEVPDLHNYTAWRDSLDPCLTEVLLDVWG